MCRRRVIRCNDLWFGFMCGSFEWQSISYQLIWAHAVHIRFNIFRLLKITISLPYNMHTQFQWTKNSILMNIHNFRCFCCCCCWCISTVRNSQLAFYSKLSISKCRAGEHQWIFDTSQKHYNHFHCALLCILQFQQWFCNFWW